MATPPPLRNATQQCVVRPASVPWSTRHRIYVSLFLHGLYAVTKGDRSGGQGIFSPSMYLPMSNPWGWSHPKWLGKGHEYKKNMTIKSKCKALTNTGYPTCISYLWFGSHTWMHSIQLINRYVTTDSISKHRTAKNYSTTLAGARTALRYFTIHSWMEKTSCLKFMSQSLIYPY